MKHTMIMRAAGTAVLLALTLSACGSAASSAAVSSSAAASSASESRAASALTSTFKASDQYDYANFNYSNGIDENGLWTGVTATQYVTLPADYNAIAIPTADVTPTDDDIQKGVNSMVAQYAAAASGDTVNIDYVGTVGGVAFQGGNTNGQGYDLVLGSGSFIAGFEDQVIGHKVGETFDVTVTFPEGYSDTTDYQGNTLTLAGREAVFTVKINSIVFGWQLTDDWVKTNLETTYDVATVADLQEYEKVKLLEANKQTYVMNYLLTNSTYNAPMPEAVMDQMVCHFLSYYQQRAEYYNTDLAAYFATYGYTSIDAALAAGEEQIVSAVHETLVYQAVAESAGLTLDSAKVNNYTSYVENYGQNYVNQYTLQQQVKEYLVKNAKMA